MSQDTNCTCEHKDHFDDYLSDAHRYGTKQPDVQHTQLSDEVGSLGVWDLCAWCRENCHKKYKQLRVS